MGRLVLIRHAESEGNRARCFTAHADVPITAHGRAQARLAGEWIRERFAVGTLVSSPYARARETAEILAEVLGTPLRLEPDLCERSYGDLAGLPYSTPRPGYDPSAYWEWRPPGGETLVDVAARAGRALDSIAVAAATEDAVVVSHGAVMMALLRHVTGSWGESRVVPNIGIVLVQYGPTGYRDVRIVEAVTEREDEEVEA